VSRLALFDLDNTLLDRSAAFLRWATGFAARRCLPADSVERLVGWDEDGYRPRADLFRSLRSEYSLSDSVEELVVRYRADYPVSYQRDDALLTALWDLRDAGWKVGIVTNGPPSQRAKVEVSGLAEVVDVCCVSEELGAAKPETAIFEAAARLAGCELRGWMTGDNPVLCATASLLGPRLT